MSQLLHGKLIGLKKIAVAAQNQQGRHAVALGDRGRRITLPIIPKALKYLGHIVAEPVDDVHVVGQAEGHGEGFG